MQLSAEVFNLDKAFQEAKKTGKNALVYLHKTGCPYCERLEEFTLDDEDVDNYIKQNYNFITLNVSHLDDKVVYNGKMTTPKEFAINIGYNFYPSVLFFNEDATLDHGSIGYIEELDFLTVLKYIKTKAFEDMSIEEYKEKLGITDEKNKKLIDKRQKL